MDAEERLTILTDQIHSLLREYTKDPLSRKREKTELEEKVERVLNYCRPHIRDMWASVVVSIILECNFRDAQRELEKILDKNRSA